MIIFSIRICRIKMNTIVYASEWVYAHLDIAMRFFLSSVCEHRFYQFKDDRNHVQ